MFELAPLLLAFPIIGVLFNGFFGRKIVESDRHGGEKVTGWFAAGMSIASFVVAVILFNALRADHHAHVIKLFDWINIESQGLNIPWALHIDTLSSTMLLIITGVGSLIHIYAIGYMHGDKDFARFFTYLNLFLFFMILLVVGSSYLVLFVGWEGVGVCSFLLIGFWFDKDRVVEDKDRGEKMYEGFVNANSARKAMIANRVGDFCMVLAMSLVFWGFGSMEYIDVFERALAMYEGGEKLTLIGTSISVDFGAYITAITALFLFGATGKSAQIPLFIWLPDAMAGPTPVSALMHAATMVTSGIYLIVRSNVLYEIARDSGYLIFDLISSPDLVALIGALTAVYAGLIAFTQFDIKKVLAYSTVSQLGFMIAAAGMGAYVAAMFHLITHAFFKALLFMGAGSVIHGMEHGHHHVHDHHKHDDHGHHPGEDAHHGDEEDNFDPQDMRFMGNLRKHMPITSTVYIIGSLALAGIFPFAGFWSKDEILAHATTNSGWAFQTVRWLLTVAAICTAFYMGRQLKMVFFGKERHEAAKHAHESPPTMTRPLMVLAVLSIVGGLLNLPYFSQAAADAAHGSSDHSAEVADSHGADSHAEDDGHSEDKDSHAADPHAEDDGHSEEIDSHGEETDSHGAAADSHGDETDAHGADDGHGDEAGHASGGYNLVVEHWLEHSIQSFELTEKGVVHMPHTPINLQYDVAIISTILAVISLVGAFFFVYGKTPTKSDDADPIFKIPVFPLMQKLPLNSFYMLIVRFVNRLADFLGITLDWDIWHDFVHNKLILAPFVAFANFLSKIVDRGVIDGGMVLGVGRVIKGASSTLKQIQTGYVRNYAFSLFVGVVALVAYFIFMV